MQDGGMDGQMDRCTDGQSETKIPPNNFIVWGYDNDQVLTR